jgi:hypothetical protein
MPAAGKTGKRFGKRGFTVGWRCVFSFSCAAPLGVLVGVAGRRQLAGNELQPHDAGGAQIGVDALD